jgi:hypothetical protein
VILGELGDEQSTHVSTSYANINVFELEKSGKKRTLNSFIIGTTSPSNALLFTSPPRRSVQGVQGGWMRWLKSCVRRFPHFDRDMMNVGRDHRGPGLQSGVCVVARFTRGLSNPGLDKTVARLFWSEKKIKKTRQWFGRAMKFDGTLIASWLLGKTRRVYVYLFTLAFTAALWCWYLVRTFHQTCLGPWI